MRRLRVSLALGVIGAAGTLGVAVAHDSGSSIEDPFVDTTPAATAVDRTGQQVSVQRGEAWSEADLALNPSLRAGDERIRIVQGDTLVGDIVMWEECSDFSAILSGVGEIGAPIQFMVLLDERATAAVLTWPDGSKTRYEPTVVDGTSFVSLTADEAPLRVDAVGVPEVDRPCAPRTEGPR